MSEKGQDDECNTTKQNPNFGCHDWRLLAGQSRGQREPVLAEPDHGDVERVQVCAIPTRRLDNQVFLSAFEMEFNSGSWLCSGSPAKYICVVNMPRRPAVILKCTWGGRTNSLPTG